MDRPRTEDEARAALQRYSEQFKAAIVAAGNRAAAELVEQPARLVAAAHLVAIYVEFHRIAHICGLYGCRIEELKGLLDGVQIAVGTGDERASQMLREGWLFSGGRS